MKATLLICALALVPGPIWAGTHSCPSTLEAQVIEIDRNGFDAATVEMSFKKMTFVGSALSCLYEFNADPKSLLFKTGCTSKNGSRTVICGGNPISCDSAIKMKSVHLVTQPENVKQLDESPEGLDFAVLNIDKNAKAHCKYSQKQLTLLQTRFVGTPTCTINGSTATCE